MLEVNYDPLLMPQTFVLNEEKYVYLIRSLDSNKPHGSGEIQRNFSNPNIQGTDRFVTIREVFELGKFLFKTAKISKLPSSE